MKPKDVGRCPKCKAHVQDDHFWGYKCSSLGHPEHDEHMVSVYDTPCTLADYKDCEYREEK